MAQLSQVRPLLDGFPWIFHHLSLSSFVIFLSYCWLFNVATSFVNGPLFNSPENLLHDSHKNLKNWFINSWCQSWHPSFGNWHLKKEKKGAHFDLNYISYFWINFQNSCACHVAFLNLSKLSKLLQLGWVQTNKITKTMWRLNCVWDTLYVLQKHKSHGYCYVTEVMLFYQYFLL